VAVPVLVTVLPVVTVSYFVRTLPITAVPAVLVWLLWRLHFGNGAGTVNTVRQFLFWLRLQATVTTPPLSLSCCTLHCRGCNSVIIRWHPCLGCAPRWCGARIDQRMNTA
jgi:hypothetical protein